MVGNFEDVATLLRNLEVESVREAAEPQERRVLIDAPIERMVVFPDHLEVQGGRLPLNVGFDEVGLGQSQKAGVGGGTSVNSDSRFQPWV